LRVASAEVEGDGEGREGSKIMMNGECHIEERAESRDGVSGIYLEGEGTAAKAVVAYALP